MSVVALRSPPVDTRPLAAERRIARVAVLDDFAAAAPHWHALDQGSCLRTPYQRFEFLELWQRHVGAAQGVTPFLVAGFDAANRPLFLWPLGRRRFVGGVRVLEFLGGKHANFNMALWRRDIAAKTTQTCLRNVLARLDGEADLAMFVNQPLTWRGTTNPFALLPRQRAVDSGYSGALVPDFEALLRARTNSDMRKKMRKKERRLDGMGHVRFERVERSEARRVLDTFFKQKSARMRMVGAADAFAAPGVRRFIEAAATGPCPDNAPVIELYALYLDDMILATFGGIVGDGRFCAMFNSILPDRYTSESPGEQLMVRLVRRCCERGLDTFDTGVGKSRFKKLFTPDPEPLFDSYLALSAAGRLPALAAATFAAGKRSIKQNPSLWSAARNLRRLRARLCG